MLAYRLRATQKEMLNLLLSWTPHAPASPPPPHYPPPPSLFFPNLPVLFLFFFSNRLFHFSACNLSFSSPSLPPSLATFFLPLSFMLPLIFFQSSPLPSAAQSHFTLLLFHPLFISLSHSLRLFIPFFFPFFSGCPIRGLVWPFNVSLCFPLLLTVSILSHQLSPSLPLRLQLMPSSVSSSPEPNIQSPWSLQITYTQALRKLNENTLEYINIYLWKYYIRSSWQQWALLSQKAHRGGKVTHTNTSPHS